MSSNCFITTTPLIQSRLNKLEKENVYPEKFIPSEIDYDKNPQLIKSQKNNKTIFDPIIGYSRLLDEDFQKRQINWVKKKLEMDHFHRHRFLMTIPDKFQQVQKIRLAWCDIQNNAGSPEIYVPTSSIDTYESLKDFYKGNTYKKQLNLVLKDNVSLAELHKILPWSKNIFNEIIIMYDDWDKLKRNYSLFFLYANTYPDKFHLCGSYWNLTKYDKEKILAVLAMCYNFKSVSFRDKEFPRFLFKTMKFWRRFSKKLTEKIEQDCIWLDKDTLTYNKEPTDTSCFGDNGKDIKDLAKRAGIKSCQTLHLLEILSEIFYLIRIDDVERNKILELESMKPLVHSLIIGK